MFGQVKRLSRVRRNVRMTPYEIPAPVGGWNNRDALASMQPTDAVALVNWFPGQTFVSARRGYSVLDNTDTGTSVDQLMTYERGSNRDLLAVSDGEVFRTLNDGSVDGTSIKSSLTSNYISYTQLGTRMVCVNGVDTPWSYDGTNAVAHGFTDASATLTFTKLIFAFTFKSRIYMIEDDSQSFWYTETAGGSSGAIAKFDLSVTGTFRGKLKILTSITFDGGTGPDDYFVAIFDSGDVVTYQGSDPGDASNWSHVGTYRIGRPLSRFGHISNGGDVTIITDRGYETLTKSTREGEGVRLKSMVSDKIQNEVRQVIRETGASDKWRIQLYNKGQMLIFQAPLDTTIRHHVRNIDTGAWCRFTLPNIRSWAVINSTCYVGDVNGKVHTFDTGDNDDGDAITFTAVSAWTSLGSAARNKILQWLKFNLQAAYFPSLSISVGTDFSKFIRSTTLSVSAQEQPAELNDSYWDDPVYWSYANQTRNLWHKHAAEGTNFAVQVTMTGRVGDLYWNRLTYYSTAGGLI